jgi:hypothetical protein
MTEEALRELERRVARMEAVNACANLMGTYQILHTAARQQEIVDLFALKTPGVRHEAATNIFDGPEKIKKFWLEKMAAQEDDLTGRVNRHDLMNPIIVAADDAKTVVGYWTAIGLETGIDEEGEFASYWAWTTYKCDFIQEDGIWKIWHMRMFPQILTPFDGKGWTDIPNYDFFPNVAKYKGFQVLPHLNPDYAPTRRQVCKPFSLDDADCDIHIPWPSIPTPYDTWHEEFDILDREMKDYVPPEK